jgi:hypothetical protein
MSRPSFPTAQIHVELPERYAAKLADVADVSWYLWHLLERREAEVDTAIGALLAAGWQTAEILGAAAAWKAYFDGPPTEAPANVTLRALEWGGEHANVVVRFHLDTARWADRVHSASARPAIAAAIDVIGRDLSDGAGIEMLRKRIEPRSRR